MAQQRESALALVLKLLFKTACIIIIIMRNTCAAFCEHFLHRFSSTHTAFLPTKNKQFPAGKPSFL